MSAFGKELRSAVEAFLVVFHEDVVLLSDTQLALFCSWLVDGGLFLDFPFYGVLNLLVS